MIRYNETLKDFGTYISVLIITKNTYLVAIELLSLINCRESFTELSISIPHKGV